MSFLRLKGGQHESHRADQPCFHNASAGYANRRVGVAWPRQVRAEWRRLSGGFLPAFANGIDFAISPDSRTVVFTADKDSDNVTELYSVPITGGMPIKLNPPLASGGDVRRFEFTPNSQAVICTADQEAANRVELYNVPVGGGTATKLNAPLVSGGNVCGASALRAEATLFAPETRSSAFCVSTRLSAFCPPVAGFNPPALLSVRSQEPE